MEREYLEKLLKNKDMIYDATFFDGLKSTSLLEFRKNINMVQDIRPSLYIEEKVKQYYEELLSQYQDESKMFSFYETILECFQKNNYDFLENYHDFDYLMDKEMLLQLNDYWHYRDRIEMASHYLMNWTSFKISEIIVDALFQDTIYNVWLNIKEIIRYHDGLEEQEKVLSKEKMKFYRNILKIDGMSNQEKIDLYHQWKDKNTALIFYQDWIAVRKHSYSKIKNCLFTIEEQKNLRNLEESKKYDVPIYELNGEDFYMMVSCKKRYSDVTDSIRDCYSLISSYHMEVFSKKNFIYGYLDFEIEDMIHVFEKDICSSHKFGSNSFTTQYVNRIMTPKQISDSKGYSEIQMLNKRKGEDKTKWEPLVPNYLVVFDQIEERHIQEAKRLHIPIFKINTSKYLDKIIRGCQNRDHLGFEKFDQISDVYTNGGDLEREKRMRR